MAASSEASGVAPVYRTTRVDSTTVLRDLVTGAITMMRGRVSLADSTGQIVTVKQHPATAADTVYVFDRSRGQTAA